MTTASKMERKLHLVSADAEAVTTLRVAIATGCRGAADVPFGQAVTFAIYDVGPARSDLVAMIEFAAVPRRCAAANDNPDDCEFRIDARMEALAGCHVIFARRIGDVAVTAAMKRHIHPIELARDEPVGDLLQRCETMLASSPPPWVRRILNSAAESTGSRHEEGAAATQSGVTSELCLASSCLGR